VVCDFDACEQEQKFALRFILVADFDPIAAVIIRADGRGGSASAQRMNS
jgi:hypothetical protein